MQTAIIILLLIFLAYFLWRQFKNNLTEESFISIVNHTFRTPLTRLRWMSESLEQELPRKEVLETAHAMSLSVNRLLEIIDTLTGIQNIHSTAGYDLKAVSIREMLEKAISKYRIAINEKKLHLAVPPLNNLPLLSIDTKKISFVINVILENAILYSLPDGMITIDAELKNNQLVLAISDTGIGLSWKDRRNLFERFYRSKEAKVMNTDGMGVGLYVSREIVRRHGGRIYARSKGLNKGTTFYIVLPIRS